EAAAFVDFLLRPDNMVRLALGDWMLPTGTRALADPALHTPERGWATVPPSPVICARRPRSPSAATPSGRTRWPPRPSRSTTAGPSTRTSCASGWRRTATSYSPATSAEGRPRAWIPARSWARCLLGGGCGRTRG
ncbi:hypothetical protein ID867_18065, partial [Streptomyces parvulus]|nr:hypothetical protein [Streptomyces parvulus]